MRRIVFLLVLLISTLAVQAQTADELYRAAIHNLKLGEKRLASTQLKRAAESLTVSDHDSLYTGIARTLLEVNDAQTAIRLLSPKLGGRFPKAEHFVVTAQAHIKVNATDSARATAQEGLRLFPKSGALYRELGITYSRDLAFDQAAQIWELGVAAEPGFAMNYYHLAKYYSQTAEQIWTIIYGETYILLSAYTIQSRDIGRLVMAAYRQGIRVYSDSTRRVQLTAEGKVSAGADRPMPNFQMAFQSNHAAAAAKVLFGRGHTEPVTVFELTDMRRFFLDYWFNQNLHERFPVALFTHWQALENQGLLEAYIIKELGYTNPIAHRELMTVNRGSIERYDAWRTKHAFEVPIHSASYNGRFSTP